MKTHIEFAHLRLVAWRKLSVFENIIETNDNPQQGKKSFRPTRCAIRIFLVSQILTKNLIKNISNFLKI
jgi:hypothetical protein